MIPTTGCAEGCLIEEERFTADQVHMMISIPPKYAKSQVIELNKGKIAIHLAWA